MDRSELQALARAVMEMAETASTGLSSSSIRNTGAVGHVAAALLQKALGGVPAADVRHALLRK